MSPTRLALRALLTMTVVWALGKYLPQYVTMNGGLAAIIVVGAILTLLNLFVRPILNILTFPLKLFATILAIILANAVFLWITLQITNMIDPTYGTFQITGGIVGWVVVSLVVGLANWVLKELLHRHE